MRCWPGVVCLPVGDAGAGDDEGGGGGVEEIREKRKKRKVCEDGK